MSRRPTHPQRIAPAGFVEALAGALTLVLVGACALSSPPEDVAGDTAVQEPPGDSNPRDTEVPIPDGDFLDAEVSTVGWDAFSRAPVVLLQELESGDTVPIWVGIAEARAIAAALQELDFLRPMTHDLMTDLLTRLDARLEEVLIHDLRDGTYYGMLELRRGTDGETLRVDTRPSDGIALALRTGARIRVARKLVENQPEIQFLPPEDTEQVVRLGGLTVVAATPELRREFALPKDLAGVLVSRSSGSALEAGLERGDLIVEVNGLRPETPAEFLDAARESGAHDPVRVRYWRDGHEAEAEFVPVPVRRTPGSRTVADLPDFPGGGHDPQEISA